MKPVPVLNELPSTNKPGIVPLPEPTAAMILREDYVCLSIPWFPQKNTDISATFGGTSSKFA